MAGLAIYTDDYTPQRVTATEAADDRDTTLLETAVRVGDRPLDLLVEFDADGDRIIWSFAGKQESTASRVDSFLADFVAPPGVDSFAAFADALRALPGDVLIVSGDEFQDDLGLNLSQVAPGTPGLPDADWEHLREQLKAEGVDQQDRPLVIGMRSYRSALAVLGAVRTADIACRVGVGTNGDPARMTDIDLVLVPGASTDFEALSESAAAWLPRQSQTTSTTSALGQSNGDIEPEPQSNPEQTDRHLLPRLAAIAVALVYLSGVVVLYRGNASFTYILLGNGGGLVATGSILGADRLTSNHHWIAVGLLVAFVTVAVASGTVAGFHAAGIERNGMAATITAGSYLGFLLSFGLYAARTTILEGSGAVVPGLRSLLPGE